MRFQYSILILSSCLLAACGDKTTPSPVPPSETAASTNNAAATNMTGAATPVITDVPAIAGSGCAAGSAQLEFQAKQASFQLTLAELEVGTGQNQKRNITCNLAIPVTIPAGYQVSIVPLHFTGTLEGNGLQLEIRREYFFAGTTGTPQVSALALPSNSQFEISDMVKDDDTLQWSSCGQDANVRANTRILVKSGEGQAKVKISSTDATQPTVFKLNYRPCT